MPVSIATARDPFRGPRPTVPALRIPQARILRALAPEDDDIPAFDWPLFTRAVLGRRAGYTPISGSVTRALDGIKRAGTKMGPAHPGLLTLGLVETVQVDVDGLIEIGYRITAAGIQAYQAFLAQGGTLPPVKDPSVCTNGRYKKS